MKIQPPEGAETMFVKRTEYSPQNILKILSQILSADKISLHREKAAKAKAAGNRVGRDLVLDNSNSKCINTQET